MPLKITKATEPIEVKRLITNLYSPPGLGKTTLAGTAAKPLLFDFDRGSHRAKNRPDTVLVDRWDDVVGMGEADFAPYQTAIIDTAGRALDVLTPFIIKQDPKMGRKSGALTLPGFGELRGTFLTWLNTLKSYGLDIILVCHSEEQRKGDDIAERLDIQGGSKQEIYKSADQMGRISLENGKRILNFSPSDVAFGKNPGELEPLEVPDFRAVPDFFAQVLVRVKAKLNELTAAQAVAAAALAEWKARVDAAASPDDFTALIEPAKASDELVRDNVKRLVMKVAKERGFVLAKDATKFEAGAPAPAAKDATAGGSTTVVGSVQEAVAAAGVVHKDQPAEREPGADDEEAANRKAAEPTQTEIAKLDTEKRSRKGKAA